VTTSSNAVARRLAGLGFGTLLTVCAASTVVAQPPQDAGTPLAPHAVAVPVGTPLWLHMGILGPMRMDYGADAGDEELRLPTVAPFAIVDNPEAPLDVADVVLIDPPGTGYSRIHGAVNFDQIAGPENDAAAVAQFVTAWRRAHGREQSPADLLGESYGTIRAALVAEQLTRDSDGGPSEWMAIQSPTILQWGGTRRCTSPVLAQKRNPALRVLVATGYFDLVTTLGMADQAVALSGLDPARVTMVGYTSGHMACIGKESRAHMAQDLRAFVTASTS